MGELIANDQIILTFSDAMLQTVIGVNDLNIDITSEMKTSFTWTASYFDLNTLKINLTIISALQGGESLIIKLVSDKKFRTPFGGCVKPSKFTITMASSLTNVAASAQAASDLTMYIVMIGVMVLFG
jgi:hypothetical protein